jgi:hypothetical protein
MHEEPAESVSMQRPLGTTHGWGGAARKSTPPPCCRLSPAWCGQAAEQYISGAPRALAAPGRAPVAAGLRPAIWGRGPGPRRKAGPWALSCMACATPCRATPPPFAAASDGAPPARLGPARPMPLARGGPRTIPLWPPRGAATSLSPDVGSLRARALPRRIGGGPPLASLNTRAQRPAGPIPPLARPEHLAQG